MYKRICRILRLIRRILKYHFVRMTIFGSMLRTFVWREGERGDLSIIECLYSFFLDRKRVTSRRSAMRKTKERGRGEVRKAKRNCHKQDDKCIMNLALPLSPPFLPSPSPPSPISSTRFQAHMTTSIQ